MRRHGDTDRVVIGRASDWGYSAAAAMWAAENGTPFLLTDGARLSPETRDFLATNQPSRRYVMGPRSSITADVQEAARAWRIGGGSPGAVSVRVAKVLWNRTGASDGDAWTPAPGYRAGGWAFALAHAPWAAVNEAPALLVRNDSVPSAVAAYLSDLDYRSGGVSGQVRAATPLSRRVVDRVEVLVGAR